VSSRMESHATGNAGRSRGPRAFGRLALGFVAASVLLGNGLVSAHPGHGLTGEGDSVAHYALEPTHGWGLVAALVIAIVAVVYRVRRQSTASDA
jgi:hypothetical protein